MRLLFAMAAIAVPFASTPAHTPSAERVASAADSRITPLRRPDSCPRTDVHPADSLNKSEFKRLDELPRGELLLAVYREVDGCPEPTIVRRGYGFGAEPPAPRVTPELPEMPRARRW